MNHSAIREGTKRRLKKASCCKLLVGIPCFNNEDTIAHVVTSVGKGLKKFFPRFKSIIVVSDGGSLDDTREKANQAKIPEGVKKIVSIYRGVPGKGSALQAVFEAAELVKAKALCTFDADLRSITPEWIKLYMLPILEEKYDYCTPAYARAKYDGTITNHIVYPVTRALYGFKIRQPIGGDFGVSGKLAKFYAQQHMEKDVARFGIDIWMTTIAINEGFKICQVNPGLKIHDPKDPAASLGPMFLEVVYTLFSLMSKYSNKWKGIKKCQEIKTYDPADERPPEPVEVSLEALKLELKDGFFHFGSLWKEIMGKETFKTLRNVVRGKIEKFSPELWARIIYDFAVVFDLWERNRHKLVDILAPLYFGRVAAFVTETQNMTSKEAERVIEKQARTFEKLKPYLNKKWF